MRPVPGTGATATAPVVVSEWRREPTPALHTCVWIGGLTAAACVAFLRPELALVGGPLLVLAAAAHATSYRTAPQLRVEVDRDVAVEGGHLEVTVSTTDDRAGLRVQFAGGHIAVLAARAGGGASSTITFPCRRWGIYRVEVINVWEDDLLGLRRVGGQASGWVDVRVYPPPVQARALLQAIRTTPLVGELIAKQPGAGIEFAGTRPFQPGDRARSLNWRATARRGEPMVTERHVERNADVILFIDTSTEHSAAADRRNGESGESGESGERRDEGRLDTSLDLAVRGAAALARGHARHRDRVGLVFFGGRVRWVPPGFGVRHVYRIAAALLDAEVAAHSGSGGLDLVPRRTIPPGAFVIALSPLVDGRALDAIADLRTRGYDVAVVDVLPALLDERYGTANAAAQRREVAIRLFELRRRAAIARLRALGVGVASWQPGQPLDLPLLELQSFRRKMARRG